MIFFRSTGSHATFTFEFGDGTRKVVPGKELSHMTVDMTMFAEALHSYSAGWYFAT